MSENLRYHEVIAQLAAADWRAGCRIVMKTLNRSLFGKRFFAFMLDLEVGKFMSIGDRTSTPIDAFAPEEMADVRNLLGTSFGKFAEFQSLKGTIVVAVVFVVGGNISEEAQGIAALLSFLFNRRQSERLAAGLNKPISFESGQEDFVANLKALALSSSGMQYGAYRSINGDWLSCLFSWGFGENRSLSEMDLRSGEFPTINQAIDTRRPAVCLDLPSEYPDIHKSREAFSNVRSFCAVPVLVGENIDGVVSFATSVYYEFTETEKNSFLCVANGMGVALSNFRLYWDGRSKGAEFDRISSSIVGVEVAQSIRHSIHDSAGNVLRSLAICENRIKGLDITEKQKEAIRVPILLAREEAKKIDDSVSNMRDVMSVDRTVKLVDIKDLWQECIHHLKYRIDEMGVHIPEMAKREKVPLLADMVKHIFHNLLLNSLDALEGIAKSRRQISLSVDSFSNSNRKIVLTYSDTGPGLDVQKLENIRRELSDGKLVTDVTEHTSLGELIFIPRVTTRTTGTGYGLYLCRRMATYHCGDIEYIQPRNNQGVSFRITLGFDIDDLVKKNAGKLQYFTRRGEKLVLEPEEFLRRLAKSDVQ